MTTCSTSRSIGLISAPGYPNHIAAKLKEELPNLLEFYVDDDCEWEVQYIEDPLTGTGESNDILNATKATKNNNHWDFGVCLTDLPLFKDKRLIIAEANQEENIALISMPSLGSTMMIKRLRESILQLVNEMYYGSSDVDREKAELHLQSMNEEHKELKNKSSTRLIGKRLLERISPIERETPDKHENQGECDVDVRFTVPRKWSIAIRIINGMVRANRPWSLFPTFMKVIMIAFTTGAYALVFPTLWQLSDFYSLPRMLILMFIAITSMVGWIILAHKLWERPQDGKDDYVRKLYNATTVLTLLATVCLYYLILYILFTIAVNIFIPIELLEAQINEEVNFTSYLYIAWLATSIATIIGALGSALEDEDVVLSSTYGYRQRQRHKQVKEQREQEEAEEDQKNVSSD
ncbi:hypothetical protein ACFQ4N_02390 [Oceanobacillus iheyensis]|uniref:hypothetical protein n=1 Tax=Oceanobacillus iheyensis TaxID=182710 RepID=UPI00363025CE